jgi:hypothetical protein
VKQNAPAPSEDEDSLPRLVGVAATVPHRRATTGTACPDSSGSPLQAERGRGQPAPTRRGRRYSSPPASDDGDSLPRLVGVAATGRATTRTACPDSSGSPLQFPTGKRRRGQPAPTRRGRRYRPSDDEDSLPRLVGVAATVPHRQATTGTSPLQAERGRGQPAPTCRGRRYSSPPASDDGDVAATGRATTRTACPDSSGSPLQAERR